MTSKNPSFDPLSRRDFLACAGLSAAAACLKPGRLSAAPAPASAATAPAVAAQFDIGILEKWFFDGGDGGPLKYSPDELAQTLDEEKAADEKLSSLAESELNAEAASEELLEGIVAPVLVGAWRSTTSRHGAPRKRR